MPTLLGADTLVPVTDAIVAMLKGAEDALLNVDAFTTALRVDHLAKIGGELLMFLDVEGASASNPNLSLDYWIGWSSALVARERRTVHRHARRVLPAESQSDLGNDHARERPRTCGRRSMGVPHTQKRLHPSDSGVGRAVQHACGRSPLPDDDLAIRDRLSL